MTEETGFTPDNEPVIDLGYLSLPGEVQEALEAELRHPAADVSYPIADEDVTLEILDGDGETPDDILREIKAELDDAFQFTQGDGSRHSYVTREWVQALLARAVERGSLLGPARLTPSDGDGRVTVDREDLRMALKFLVHYVPLDNRGADWAAVERIHAAVKQES